MLGGSRDINNNTNNVSNFQSYQRLFSDKIQNSSGLTNISWRVANFATGILSYPLGIASFVINLMGKSESNSSHEAIHKHNENVRNKLVTICKDAEQGNRYRTIVKIIINNDDNNRKVEEFDITASEAKAAFKRINNLIDYYSGHNKKVDLEIDETNNSTIDPNSKINRTKILPTLIFAPKLSSINIDPADINSYNEKAKKFLKETCEIAKKSQIYNGTFVLTIDPNTSYAREEIFELSNKNTIPIYNRIDSLIDYYSAHDKKVELIIK